MTLRASLRDTVILLPFQIFARFQRICLQLDNSKYEFVRGGSSFEASKESLGRLSDLLEV